MFVEQSQLSRRDVAADELALTHMYVSPHIQHSAPFPACAQSTQHRAPCSLLGLLWRLFIWIYSLKVAFHTSHKPIFLPSSLVDKDAAKTELCACPRCVCPRVLHLPRVPSHLSFLLGPHSTPFAMHRLCRYIASSCLVGVKELSVHLALNHRMVCFQRHCQNIEEIRRILLRMLHDELAKHDLCVFVPDNSLYADAHTRADTVSRTDAPDSPHVHGRPDTLTADAAARDRRENTHPDAQHSLTPGWLIGATGLRSDHSDSASAVDADHSDIDADADGTRTLSRRTRRGDDSCRNRRPASTRTSALAAAPVMARALGRVADAASVDPIVGTGSKSDPDQEAVWEVIPTESGRDSQESDGAPAGAGAAAWRVVRACHVWTLRSATVASAVAVCHARERLAAGAAKGGVSEGRNVDADGNATSTGQGQQRDEHLFYEHKTSSRQAYETLRDIVDGCVCIEPSLIVAINCNDMLCEYPPWLLRCAELSFIAVTNDNGAVASVDVEGPIMRTDADVSHLDESTVDLHVMMPRSTHPRTYAVKRQESVSDVRGGQDDVSSSTPGNDKMEVMLPVPETLAKILAVFASSEQRLGK